MKIAILSVSERGKKLSSELKKLLDEDPTIIGINTFHKNIKGNIDNIFNNSLIKYDAIIGIMATGILIRNICSKIQDKTTDPAILSMDDNGKYVISLVSGHIGGANELTKKVAKILKNKAVITTATDTNDKIGIDTLANILYWEILNKNEILYFNKAILEEKRVKLYINLFKNDEIRYKDYIGDYLENQEKNTVEIIDLENKDTSIEDIQDITFTYNSKNNIEHDHNQNKHDQYNHNQKDNPYNQNNNQYNQNNNQNKHDQHDHNQYKDFNVVASFNNHRMFFKPRKLVLGIGSRANIPKEKVIETIQIAMNNLNLPIERIDSLATVEIKKDENGILDAVKEINKPLNIVTIDRIKEFKNTDITNSNFVQKKFDIPGVAEPAALIIAGSNIGNSKLIHRKIAIDGVTVAVAISD